MYESGSAEDKKLVGLQYDKYFLTQSYTDAFMVLYNNVADRLAKAAPGLIREEDWFMQAPPVGDELASIIILCCNQVDYTRLCLDSVLRHTHTPYELILVDNGSTDETPDYLEEVAT